jgi:hypothetical protein
MRKTDLTTVVKEYVKVVTCNMCGKHIDRDKNEFIDWQLDSFFEFKISFGYGTGKDGELWSFDLCENCVEKITEKFIIPVEKEDYL